jgi:hypothetical protein
MKYKEKKAINGKENKRKQKSENKIYKMKKGKEGMRKQKANWLSCPGLLQTQVQQAMVWDSADLLLPGSCREPSSSDIKYLALSQGFLKEFLSQSE